MMARKPRFLLPVVLLALSTSALASAKTHEVTQGDSLWSLAKKYGVSVEALQQANRLEGEKIKIGQKLTIPTGKASPPEPAKSRATEPEAKKEKAAPEAKKTEPEAKPKPAEPEAKAKKTEPVPPAQDDRIKAEDPPKPERLPPLTKAQRARAEELYLEPELSPAPSTLAERAPDWVLAKPGPSTQVQKTNAARGGIFPCAAPDPGFGTYAKWHQVAPMAHVLVPKDLRLDASGGFDAMFHFHGREPIRKEWVKGIDNAVLIAVDVGIASSAYGEAFRDPRTFGEVLRATEAQVDRRLDRKGSRVRHVGVSAWSAGYGAVQQLLTQPYPLEVIDTVVLLDGLHSGYVEHSLDREKLAPFVRFAERAANQETFMFVSHSSILTQGYASTTETAQYLIWKVGGQPQSGSAPVSDPMGLERISWFSRGNFHVRGFKGNAAADHCAHLGLMRDVLRVHVAPRWQRPRETTPEADVVEAVARR